MQGKTALNFGASSQEIFLADAGSGADHIAAAQGVSRANPWRFGPSSEHPGIVQHLAADGAVKYVSDEIDPTLYMRLITRAGKEPDPLEVD